MKRILVIAIVTLLLPIWAASAESKSSVLGEFAGAFPAVTVTGALTVNRDAAREAMSRAGLPESEIGLWDGLLALLADTDDRLVIADQGFEYSLTGSDGETAFVAGETRDGETWIVSSLFPHTALTCPASETDWQEIAATADAVVGGLHQAVETVAAAVTENAPVSGRYKMDGEVFDLCVPLNIDAQAMVNAGMELARGLMTNEVLPVAGLGALSGAAGIQADAASLPAVTAARYSAEGTRAVLYAAELVPAHGKADAVRVLVREDGNDVRVKIDALDQALGIAAEYFYTENAVNLRVDVRYGGNDYALTSTVQTGDMVTMTTALYFAGMDAPLVAETNTFTMNGTRTIAIDAESKTVLELWDVVDDNGGARARLLADVIAGGLPGLTGFMGM